MDEHEETRKIIVSEHSRASRPKGRDSRQRIKQAAIELFSAHHIHGVSTRDIRKAAGLRNENAIQYYFGSKDGLLREIILDFIHDIEVDRNRRVDAMEAAGGPTSVREIMRIYTTFPGSVFDSSPTEARYINYFETIAVNYTEFLINLVEKETGTGTSRCLAHLRTFMSHLLPLEIHRRFALMNLFVITGLTSREEAGKRPLAKRGLWGDPAMFESFLDCIEGMLLQPAFKTNNLSVRKGPRQKATKSRAS